MIECLVNFALKHGGQNNTLSKSLKRKEKLRHLYNLSVHSVQMLRPETTEMG